MNYTLMFNQIQPYLSFFIKGLVTSVILAIIGMFLGSIIGMSVGFFRDSNNKIIRTITNIYVEIFRNTPLLIQMYLIYFGLPQFNISISAIQTAIIAITLNNGAYTGVIFQSGYKAVDKGQEEAAIALGMNKKQIIKHIVIPQGFRIVLAPLTNQFISIFLFTSVASTISVRELLTETLYVDTVTMRTFEVFIVTTLLYLIGTTIITVASNLLERKMKY